MHFEKSAYTSYINRKKRGNCDKLNISYDGFLGISEEKENIQKSAEEFFDKR